MSDVPGRRGLQLFLTLLAGVMVVAGSLSAIFGPGLVPREGVVAPDVDTELRFFSVWYAVAGIALLRSIPQPGTHGPTIRLIAAGFFAAGCARVLSWISVGAPHALFVVLMVVELLLALLIVPWQAKVARAEPARAHQSGQE